MNVEIDSRVGEIATKHPLATRVFARHGIDFCCGGGKPLSDVCATLGLSTEAVLTEIQREIDAPASDPVRWDEAPLDDLIQHILTTYHVPLKEELPRLEAMARKVVDVHGQVQPETLPQLLEVYLALAQELEEHMEKEEQVLFPMIQDGRGSSAGDPVASLEHEHESAGRALARLRILTDGYRVPEEACNTWRALWHGLAALEESLHQHIHLENNILFPRALAEG